MIHFAARSIFDPVALCGQAPGPKDPVWLWSSVDTIGRKPEACRECIAAIEASRAGLAAAYRTERDRREQEAREARRKRPAPSARKAEPAPEPPAEAPTRPTPGPYPVEAIGVPWEDLEASRFTQNDDHKATEERPRKARLVTVRGFPYLNTGGHWNGIAADGRRFDEIQLTPAYPEEGWDGPRTARPDPGTGYLGMPVIHRGKRYRLGHKDERINIHRFKESAPAPSAPPAEGRPGPARNEKDWDVWDRNKPEPIGRVTGTTRGQAHSRALDAFPGIMASEIEVHPPSIAEAVASRIRTQQAGHQAEDQADEEQAPEVDLCREHNARMQAEEQAREPVPGAISAMTAALPHNGPTAEDRAAKRRGPYRSDREWDIWIENGYDHPYSTLSAPTRKEATAKAVAAFPGLAPAQMQIAPAADRYAIRDKRADARAKAREKEEARREKEETKALARSERQAKADRARQEKERAKEAHARARADMPTAEEPRAAVEAKNRVDAMMARAVRGEHDDAGRAEWRQMIEQHEAMKDRDPETLVIFARPYGWHEIIGQDAMEYGRIADEHPTTDQATGLKFVVIPDIDAACRRIIEAGRRAAVIERVKPTDAEATHVERIVTPGRIDEPAEAPPAPKARRSPAEPRPEPQAMREWACLDGKGRCLSLVEATNAEAALRIANIGAPIKAVRAVPNEE